MIYAIRNCENGHLTYIEATSGYNAINLFLKSINQKSTVMVHENFYYAIVDGVVYSVRKEDD